MKDLSRLLLYLLILSFSIGLCNCKQNRPDDPDNSKEKKQVVDIDGNNYPIVKIGKQFWIAENLRVTSYNNGEPIPIVSNGMEWYELRTPAYCWYNNDTASIMESYGALYNYHAINSGKLCPTGWHVPTYKDFKILISSLDPDADFVSHEASYTAGGMLKETGPFHWAAPNTKATNETGFNALPGGCRSYAGNFSTMSTFAYFGSSTDDSSLALRFASGSAYMRKNISKYVGVSVRCVKNQ